jgi:putative transposase
MFRNFEFRIWPSKTQQVTISIWQQLCCELYNACLAQRRAAWSTLKHKTPEERKGRLPTLFSQIKALPEIKQVRPEFKLVYARVLFDPIDRVQKAFDGFFRRVKTGVAKVGYPRFKTRARYNTITYSQKGFKLIPAGTRRNGRLWLSKIGEMPVKDWKTFPTGTRIKRVSIKQVAGKWFAVLCCDLPNPAPLPKTGKSLGLDVGLSAIAVDSDGKRYGALSALKTSEQVTRKIQQMVSRKKKGSGRRRAAVRRLQTAHARLARQRKYQLHQIANEVIGKADLIGIEKLAIKQMTAKANGKSTRGLRRNIHSASWGLLGQILSYKAAEAGRQVIQVDPRGTSQECSSCGAIVPKALSVRRHICSCGCDLDRDHNAAINVLKRALRAQRGAGSSNRPAVKREVRRKKSASCATSTVS